ncbi:MAG: TIGR03960 family B12-binding radical SAM protein [Pseudomonadota bacterium]
MAYPFLAKVRKPSQYLGTEINSVHKDWDGAKVRVALVFPDLYDVGMSHLGLAILYHILNSREEFLAERAFAPDTDLEALLRDRKHPLLSLESGTPLKDFDIIGFTLPYELCYTNVLTVLDTAGIPFYAEKRDSDWPLIIGGGACAVNPEPVADFFDAFLIGDGEEAVIEIAETYGRWKEGGGDKRLLLRDLSGIEGMYVPSFCESSGSNQDVIRRRIVADLDRAAFPIRPVVPYAKPVHDRISLEISRGCTRGCRFCQAGVIYRPVRERKAETCLGLAEKCLSETGYEEISLLSLSTGDYGNLQPLLKALMNRHSRDHVAVSMPSLRVGTLTPEIMAEIKRVRKTGFTLAPEAGTARLRAVINKNISEQDLLETAREAFGAGWNLLKLYFMIGLPAERSEDLDGIAELAMRVLDCGRGSSRRCHINLGISTFVPKPHTPFQWQPQVGIEESRNRLDHIRKKLRSRQIELKWHDPKQSFLEGVFARGDRKLARFIEYAYGVGCRLDGWGDYFQFSRWRRAAEETGIDLDHYLRARGYEESLPWSHIDCLVSREFLLGEANKAVAGEMTPDCRTAGCVLCGVCNGKERKMRLSPSFVPQYSPMKTEERDGEPLLLRIHYGKLESARFLGHLELTRIFSRALRRIGLNLSYSQGFHPMPKIVFSPALPVGTESLAEYIDLEIEGHVGISRLKETVQEELPEGFVVYKVEKTTGAVPAGGVTHYIVRSSSGVFVAPAIEHFLSAEKYPISQDRKDRIRTVDIRLLVKNIEYIDGQTITLSVADIQAAGAKPAEILKHVFNLSDTDILELRIVKLPERPEKMG